MRSFSRPNGLGVTILAASLLAGAAVSGWAQAQAPSTLIDGTVASISGNDLVLTVADGSSKSVTVRDETLIQARQQATLDSIKAGDALGIAARRGSDGTLIANSINIFSPQVWGRVKRGQFPMQSGEIMTNAVVTQTEARVDGRVLSLQLEDRIAAITVPEGAQIHRMITQRLSDLKPGMRIVVRGTPSQDGIVAASSINFELPAM